MVLLRPIVLLAGGNHEDSLAQFKGSRSRHPFAGGESREDHDLVVEYCVALDLLRVNPGAPILVGRDHEDLISARPLTQRADWDGNSLAGYADRNADPDRSAWRGSMVGARDLCPDRGITGDGIDARVDRDDPGRDRSRLVARQHVD